MSLVAADGTRALLVTLRIYEGRGWRWPPPSLTRSGQAMGIGPAKPPPEQPLKIEPGRKLRN